MDLTCIPKEYILCAYCPIMPTPIRMKQPGVVLQYRRHSICDYTPTDLCTNWSLNSGTCSNCHRYYYRKPKKEKVVNKNLEWKAWQKIKDMFKDDKCCNEGEYGKK